jgi:hypothetical protein
MSPWPQIAALEQGGGVHGVSNLNHRVAVDRIVIHAIRAVCARAAVSSWFNDN